MLEVVVVLVVEAAVVAVVAVVVVEFTGHLKPESLSVCHTVIWNGLAPLKGTLATTNNKNNVLIHVLFVQTGAQL